MENTGKELKTCVKIPLQKYIKFKGQAATKYKWKRGYTTKALNEAIDLWLQTEKIKQFFDKEPN